MTQREMVDALSAISKSSVWNTDIEKCTNSCACSSRPNGSNVTKKKMPNRSKTVLVSNGKFLNVEIADKDGFVGSTKYIMPDIVDVKTIERQHKSQVIVYFGDSTSETATLEYGDTYNLEQGISICIAKKLISNLVGKGYGSSIYNKLIERAIKVYKRSCAETEKKRKEEEEQKARYQKMVQKKQAKRQKREAENRERQIEIQKEAYLRAMREYRDTPVIREVLD